MSQGDPFCPVQAALELLQRKWTLHIIRCLLEGPRGFNELARAVGGANPRTLAGRLRQLEEAGVVAKEVESTMPPRTRYYLTPAGRELQGVIDAIAAWGKKHLTPDA